MTRWGVRLLLWLFVVNLGITFGAGLYEARIVVPEWLAGSPETGYRWDAAAAREADTGRRFWAFVTTGPLTLLTAANLVAGWRARGTLRRWWVGAALAALADRAFTFSYFIPTMLTLMRDDTMPQPEAVRLALQWANLNHLRHAIVLVAWLAALKAFSLSSERRA
ncbi:MAG TPA: DUF1772 domain-containing protein [Thermodesulfobacteriota bacterium]